MRLVIRTRKMRKNIYGKKKYLEEGMRGKLIGHSQPNTSFISSTCPCNFVPFVDVFVRGKWSDDNEYVVMLRVRRRRVVISYIICNWSQSIVSISPWSHPHPHLRTSDSRIVHFMYRGITYYLARDTDSSAWRQSSIASRIASSLKLSASNKVFAQFC